MFVRVSVFLVVLALLCPRPQGFLARAKHTTSGQDCPYGYGDGCDNFWGDFSGAGKSGDAGSIDEATKKKVADILGGIITSLSKPLPRLVEMSGAVARSNNALTVTSEAEAHRVLGSLLSSLQGRSASDSAKLLSSLAGTKVDEQSAVSVAGMLSNILAGDADICPFGFGCGGGGEIDPATKAQVANILKGIISSMSNHKSLAQVSIGGRMALGSLLATLRSSHRSKALAVVAKLTGSKADAKTLADALSQMLKASDCPFGYGCGGGGPISSGTKAEVANILKGILSSLGNHR